MSLKSRVTHNRMMPRTLVCSATAICCAHEVPAVVVAAAAAAATAAAVVVVVKMMMVIIEVKTRTVDRGQCDV